MKPRPLTLTEEEKAAGVTLVEIPLSELETVDVSDKNVEKMARGFILGSQAIGRRKEIRDELETRVTKKIGKKGRYLTDKLFELIEGIYMEERSDKHGIRYYKVPPNLNAIIYALDRVLGKPTQHIEASEEKKGIILVEHVIRNLASNPYKNNDKRKQITSGGSIEESFAGAGDNSGNFGDDQTRINEGVGEIAV